MSFSIKGQDAGAMRARLASLLLEKSYRAGEVTLTSGRKSDYYFDCKQTALHPEGAWLIGNLLFDLLPPDIVGVGGMTLKSRMTKSPAP